MNRHSNNFDFLRLIFALFVIITHSFNLIDLSQSDWLGQLTKGQITFSHLGVSGFFSISGYLIIKSLQRSSSISAYMRKRALRLFPALFAMLTLTVVFGAFISEVSFSAYFSHYKTYLYIPANISLYRLQDFLPGVFTSNPLSGAINGSLWTLPYEFSCYLVLLLLFSIRNNSNLLKAVCAAAMILLLFTKLLFFKPIRQFDFVLAGEYILEFGGFFAMGSCIAVYDKWFKKHLNFIAAFSIVILICSLYFNVFSNISFVILPTVVIALGLYNTPYISSVSKHIGDLSYGIYIYAFPIQQTLIHFGIINPYHLMLATALLAICFAFASWHLVEKHFLKQKKPSVLPNAQ